jgi:glycerol-3-phosphate dehydrogenase
MELQRLERALDSGRRWSFFNYEDAQCEFPERLVAEWLTDAISAGAVVRNHTQALAVDVSHGRVHGVLLRDSITLREERIDAGWVINCSGPWADRVCNRSSIRMKNPMVGGVRGSHIVLPRFSGAPSTALYTEAADGRRRPFFVLPWNDQILAGTTEVADTGDPGSAVPSTDEINYLVKSLTQLFPKAKITAQSIKYAFAGIRPLPYSPKQSPSDVTRRHIVHDHAGDGALHMLSVIGGKLSTAAALARECAHKIGAKKNDLKDGANSNGRESLAVGPGAALDPLLDEAILQIARIGSVSEESARGMVEWHGKRAADIARMALVSAELRAPICPHTSHLIAEVVEAYRRECAVTLADVLLRRVPVALGPCWSEACSREAALRIGAVLGWDTHALGSNLEAFETERAAFLHRPSRPAAFEAAAD